MDAGPRAYRVDRAFDGEAMITGGALILVEGARITAVEPGGTPTPTGFTEIALPGATALPGLVNTHVHLCAGDELDALSLDTRRSPDEREAVIRKSLAAQLTAGTTTVRDLGDTAYAVVDRTPQPGEPRVVASGPPITTPGGHCAAMGGAAAGPAALERAVAERAEHGVRVVKIIVSGGAMTAGSDLLALQFVREEVALVVREAHRVGLAVTAHAHSLGSAEVCVDAGVDGIEHFTCLTERGVVTPDALVEGVLGIGIVVGPTFGRLPGSTHSAEHESGDGAHRTHSRIAVPPGRRPAPRPAFRSSAALTTGSIPASRTGCFRTRWPNWFRPTSIRPPPWPRPRPSRPRPAGWPIGSAGWRRDWMRTCCSSMATRRPTSPPSPGSAPSCCAATRSPDSQNLPPDEGSRLVSGVTATGGPALEGDSAKVRASY